jgi:predicted nucleic acid-binding protein
LTPLIVDTGPLVALLSRRDRHHSWTVAVVADAPAPLLTCEAVLAESAWLLRHVPGGVDVILELLRRQALAVAFALGSNVDRVAGLTHTYRNVPMSLADACLVRMSESMPKARVLTFDGDFRVYRRFDRRIVPVLMP